ncbi:MAG TPA: hypothetical protein PLZ69_00285 [Candidatus Pacearchaeota archaeon]|jgi:hypothetical protein|nr:hypothetical protein [Candidatus Pacearchaeota archaeon]
MLKRKDKKDNRIIWTNIAAPNANNETNFYLNGKIKSNKPSTLIKIKKDKIKRLR